MLLTTAVLPQEKACKTSGARELTRFSALGLPFLAQWPDSHIARAFSTYLMKVCCLLFLLVLGFPGEEECCKK